MISRSTSELSVGENYGGNYGGRTTEKTQSGLTQQTRRSRGRSDLRYSGSPKVKLPPVKPAASETRSPWLMRFSRCFVIVLEKRQSIRCFPFGLHYPAYSSAGCPFVRLATKKITSYQSLSQLTFHHPQPNRITRCFAKISLKNC